MFDYKNRSVFSHIMWATICALATICAIKNASQISGWYWIIVPFTLLACVMNIVSAIKK